MLLYRVADASLISQRTNISGKIEMERSNEKHTTSPVFAAETKDMHV